MFCINKSSMEFQTIVKQSGLPEDLISAICGDFIEKYNRFPRLDEIPYSNSIPYIEKYLNIVNNAVNTSQLLNKTGTESVEDAQIYLNNIFHDVQIEMLQLGETTEITITKRPIDKPIQQTINPNNLISNYALFENIINKLKNLYGIKINEINSDIINEQFSNIPNLSTAKAFILNGEIYINTELADKDAPVHETMHLLIGELKTINPTLYYELINYVSTLPYFNKFKQNFANRTESDIAEELFVEEVSKLISGKESILPKEITYELTYTTKRILNSILMGDCSVYGNYINKSLIQLGIEVNSQLFNTKIPLGMDHRIIQNKKKQLLEENKLKEICYA